MHPYFCFTREADRREKKGRKSFFVHRPAARAYAAHYIMYMYSLYLRQDLDEKKKKLLPEI